MHPRHRRWSAAYALVATVLSLASCDGGSTPEAGAVAASTHTVGGAVSGLAAGASVVLQNNGKDALTVQANGKYVFANPVASGSTYDVTVGQQPPRQTCTVSRPRGAVASSDVTDVDVACVATTRTVGGTLSGLQDLKQLLPGLTITLRNNGGDALPLTADGPFTFATSLAEGASYAVTVGSLVSGATTLPAAICPVTNGSGTVSGSNVVSVVVSCVGPAYKQLYSFTGGDDGALPQGALVADATGNLYGTTREGGTSKLGTVFRIAADGTGFTRLVSFSGTDGATPSSGLLVDGSGNFYGTTVAGGANDFGTVFKLAPSGAGTYVKTVLHSFAGGADGRYPEASLALDASGKLLGTTRAGGDAGAGDDGTVFRLSVDGTGYGVLHAFDGVMEGSAPSAKLVRDASGNFFGTTSGGNGSVFKVAPNGAGGYATTVVYKFSGSDTGLAPFAGLAVDAAGNLFGTTYKGGPLDVGVVFKLAPFVAGYTNTLLLELGTDEEGAKPLGGLLLTKNGTLYGTTSEGGKGGGALFALRPDGSGGYVKDVRYVFGTNLATDGVSPQADLIVDAQGRLYGTTLRGGAKNFGTVFRFAD